MRTFIRTLPVALGLFLGAGPGLLPAQIVNLTIQGSGANNATNPIQFNSLTLPDGSVFTNPIFPVGISGATFASDGGSPNRNTHRVILNDADIDVLQDGTLSGAEVSLSAFPNSILGALQNRDLNHFVDTVTNTPGFGFTLQFPQPHRGRIAYFERGGEGTNSWLLLTPVDAAGTILPGGRSFLIDPDSGRYIHRASIPAANTAADWNTTAVIGPGGSPTSAPSNSLVVATWSGASATPSYNGTQILGFYDLTSDDLFLNSTASADRVFTYLRVSLPQVGTSYPTRRANSTVVTTLNFTGPTSAGSSNRGLDIAPDFTIFVLVPEPRVYAVAAGLLALGLAFLRRRRG